MKKKCPNCKIKKDDVIWLRRVGDKIRAVCEDCKDYLERS